MYRVTADKADRLPMRKTYETDSASIEGAIDSYGVTEDRILIWGADGYAVAGAVWPQGWRQYHIMTKAELAELNSLLPAYRGCPDIEQLEDDDACE